MDNRRMMGGGMLPSPEKEVPSWKEAISKEGHKVRIPSSKQLKPSKYKPSTPKAPKNQPHCINTGVKTEAIIRCHSCMWQGICK